MSASASLGNTVTMPRVPRQPDPLDAAAGHVENLATRVMLLEAELLVERADRRRLEDLLARARAVAGDGPHRHRPRRPV